LAAVSCCDRLRILRTAVGWTQSELASQLGISRRSVIRYERAQQRSEWPRLSVLLRLRQVEADHEQQLLGHLARKLRLPASRTMFSVTNSDQRSNRIRHD